MEDKSLSIKNIAIIGGGAAGFFSAISAKEHHPHAEVVIFEKSQKLLAKVKISGGGRCNVTNGCKSLSELSEAYPRGGKRLKKAFRIFNNSHVMEWFESRGVPLYVQDDMRVFPVSNNSQSIIDCLLQETTKLQIKIEPGVGIKSIKPVEDHLELRFSGKELPPRRFDRVVVASGGSPKREGLEWLEALGHKIEDPVPSLFSFNMPTESIKELMGVSVENALVNIQGTKLKSGGPLLITHWGMSGPAILKLSAFGARTLKEMDYGFNVQVNWVNEASHKKVEDRLLDVAKQHPKKKIANFRPYDLPERLWLFLLEKRATPSDKVWGEVGKKLIDKLVNTLANDIFEVKGKTTFKEEFVTCGGVALESVHMTTMESKVCNHLYFAGEVLDIDAITGGYNFQAAWTTGFIAGKLG